MLESIFKFILAVSLFIEGWLVFKKMGRYGWEALIPLYSIFVEFEVVYGSGWRMLSLLIPFYNFYVLIKLKMDEAVGFGKSKIYGFGMLFLGAVFYGILAFDDGVMWKDGSMANDEDDILSSFINRFKHSSDDPLDMAGAKLRKLNDLYADGLLSEEEFNEKRNKLINKL